MPDLDTIGDRLRYVRTQRGFTLEKLAGLAGVSKSFLSEIEHDRTGVTADKLIQIASALNASLDFLLKGEGGSEERLQVPVEIPVELGDLAEELDLSYRDTAALSDMESSIVARRSSKSKERKTKEQWRALYEGVKEFLGEDDG